jgi:hypothetical protein
MSFKKIISPILINLSLLLAFAAGWLGAEVYRVNNRPPVQAVAEVNPGVALIELKKSNAQYLTGKISGAPARIFLDEKIVLSGTGGEFEIPLVR